MPPFKWAQDALPEEAVAERTVKMSCGDGTVFFVSDALARQCQLLTAVLDTASLDGPECEDAGDALSLAIPEADAASLTSVLTYLTLASIRVPSIIGRPLRAPLPELLQPWEWDYIKNHGLVEGDATKHQGLLKIMRLSEFLSIHSLRDLSCAFFASIVLSCASVDEVAKLFNKNNVLEDQAKDAEVFEQFPFLADVQS